MASLSPSLRSQILIVMAGVVVFFGCTKKNTETVTPVEQGRKIYVSYCVSCHGTDPKVNGALGPAIWGSSKELLAARVLKLQYPPGYKPKRDTKIMTTFPLSDDQITALQVYLNQ